MSLFNSFSYGNQGGGGSKVDGVMVAIVTDNKDPENLGRVKVKFPLRSGEEESDWARIAMLLAGKDRGTLFIPEVGDEVLVAFHLGEMVEPYVIGMLWNKDMAPPDGKDDKNNIRKIKSRSGHEFIFDDTDGKEKVTLKTKKGHTITLDDENEIVKIEESTQKNFIEIKGTSSGQITIKSSGGAASTITMNAQGDISVESAKSVKVKSAQITIEADGIIEVKAGGNLSLKANGICEIKGSMVKIN